MSWLVRVGEAHECDIPNTDFEEDYRYYVILKVGDRWRCDVCMKIYSLAVVTDGFSVPDDEDGDRVWQAETA